MSRVRSDGRLSAKYDAGSLARLLRQYDDELNRITAFQGTVSWNPASVANGASTSTTVPVPGAKVNSPAHVRVFAPYTLSGLQADGYVSADDTATITLNNNTGGPVDLGLGTWGVVVENMVRTT